MTQPVGERSVPNGRWISSTKPPFPFRSVSLIARDNNINTNQVFRWIREVKKGQSRWVRVAMGMQSLMHKEEPAAFLPVITSPPKQPVPAPSSITVELTTGHRVTVDHADEQLVRILLSALL
ncbi:IS66 family insertion sequence element accessory protein TnpB [Alteromonas pelagimontana]|uniref:IS66 family insertion sequence element accessory protein TnpB n=1 Tax=Alteromonas pelagimontana TaxID=1858656 RepID=A0A6M4MA88_9ALTE|nr:hypothetical protein [Alteromonas pelagimontana]QJR79738.1 IS66 family insertion sequence element accessory protein TnpB [Alteromonas pelagimontana]